MEIKVLKTLVPHHFCGQRIDSVLAQLLPEFSRSQLCQWLKEGRIRVNQNLVKPRNPVIGGEEIHAEIPEKQQEYAKPENIPLDIIYEDEALLIINKPAGLVVHPGAANPNHTLVNALLHYMPSLDLLPRAGIIHRLDKDTTGLLLIAKHLISYNMLVRAMQAREIKRIYTTLVNGPISLSGSVKTNYGRHPHNRIKMAVCKQGREAITFYRVKKNYPQFALLEVELLTGRTHQIRVHMAHIRHPVVGDPLYGNRSAYLNQKNEALREQLQLFKRQALHARSLSFHHPTLKELLTVEAPLPDDFQHLLHCLDEDFEIFDE